jgi:hypothetical protein
MNISGTFNVQMNPLESELQGSDGVQLARMGLEKNYQGELQASSRGEMLSAVSETPGSAGYVALERVEGSLSGLTGSFVLQHFGVMQQGESELQLKVVPDSGTGQLKGLRGRMGIRIEDGQHFYDFDYQL